MDKAIEFYSKALGLNIIENTKLVEESETAIGRMCIVVFSEGLEGLLSLTWWQLKILVLNYFGWSYSALRTL